MHFLALVAEAEPSLTGPDQKEWLERLETEHDNLRAALEWSDGLSESGDLGLRLCGLISYFWYMRGYLSDGRVWCERALGKAGAYGRIRARAKALIGAGRLTESLERLRLCCTITPRGLGGSRESEIGMALPDHLYCLGWVTELQGDSATSHARFEESLEICRELGDRWGVSKALMQLGNHAPSPLNGRDTIGARGAMQESLAIMRENRRPQRHSKRVDQPWGVVWALRLPGGAIYPGGKPGNKQGSWRPTRDCLRIMASGKNRRYAG